MDNLHKIIHETLLIMEIIIKVAIQSSFSDLIMFCPFYFGFLKKFIAKCLFIYLFIFGSTGSSLLCAGFLWLHQEEATLLWCAGFSLWWLLLWSTGFSRYGSWALELWLSSWGTRDSLFWGMWYLPWPGIEPMTPALAGRLLTTEPPGKYLTLIFFDIISSQNNYYFCFKYIHPKHSAKILCSMTTILELVFPL